MSHKCSSNCIWQVLQQENDLQGHPRSLEMAQIDRPYDTSCYCCVVTTCVSCTICLILPHLRCTWLLLGGVTLNSLSFSENLTFSSGVYATPLLQHQARFGLKFGLNPAVLCNQNLHEIWKTCDLNVTNITIVTNITRDWCYKTCAIFHASRTENYLVKR